jgi:hypothetical protein
VELPASDRRRIVTVVETETTATRACADDIGIEVVDADSSRRHQEAVQRRCVPTLRVLLDGEPAAEGSNDEFYIGQYQMVVAPGAAHGVAVEVTEGDPRYVQYAVVIWEERS